MSNALAHAHEFNTQQLELIKANVAKGATPDELSFFLYRCKIMDLNPLKPGHIHFVKYGSNPGTIIIGIDGFRSKAAKTGKHSGTKRGVTRDESGKCIGAWCEVYRSDWVHPAREEVSMNEYNTGKAQWAKMPETMIKKVAEVAALRMAFPDELGGIYSDDEMAQAEHEKTVEPKNPLKELRANQAAAADDYICTFGKFKGQKLGELNIHDLSNYVDYIQAEALKSGKEIRGQVYEFMTKAGELIDSRMPKPPPTDWEKEEIPL